MKKGFSAGRRDGDDVVRTLRRNIHNTAVVFCVATEAMMLDKDKEAACLKRTEVLLLFVSSMRVGPLASK
jgi:hypothetical protein